MKENVLFLVLQKLLRKRKDFSANLVRNLLIFMVMLRINNNFIIHMISILELTLVNPKCNVKSVLKRYLTKKIHKDSIAWESEKENNRIAMEKKTNKAGMNLGRLIYADIKRGRPLSDYTTNVLVFMCKLCMHKSDCLSCCHNHPIL